MKEPTQHVIIGLVLFVFLFFFFFQYNLIVDLQDKVRTLEENINTMCNPSMDDEDFITVLR